MTSADGRWVVSYNGEILNAEEIRRDPSVAGVKWRGHSDTEVLVESVASNGITAAIKSLNGMYAMALWDRRERVLHLVRDRIGIKPLFFTCHRGKTAFGSEIKALLRLGFVPREIDAAAVSSYLKFGYVPAPGAILGGIEKVMPGEIVSIGVNGRISRSRYWRLEDAVAEGFEAPLQVDDREAIETFSSLLVDAVSRQMISDVPLGAFLSGGIYSSSIAALMIAAGKGPVRTFSIGFPDLGFDESVYAARVARHIGSIHSELVITAADALATVPLVPEMYDEPLADASQIPAFLASKLTRGHVTVALSGDGGDELFAGYDTYKVLTRVWRYVGPMPVRFRLAAGGILGPLPPAVLNQLSHLFSGGMVPQRLGDKVRNLSHVLSLDPDGVHTRLVSRVPDVGLHMADRENPPGLGGAPPGLGVSDRARFLDTVTYLPDEQKVDRASMAVALETRPPLLDHRIVEFVWRLPRRFLVRNGETKWLLRQVLDRYVPRHLVERPKMGFSVPIGEWLRGPLRDWAEDLFAPARYGGGILDVKPAQEIWPRHILREKNGSQLWTLLSFEAWRRHWAEQMHRRPAQASIMGWQFLPSAEGTQE
jgi:asparagine synthase (glutamine-hydrolysing)